MAEPRFGLRNLLLFLIRLLPALVVGVFLGVLAVRAIYGWNNTIVTTVVELPPIEGTDEDTESCGVFNPPLESEIYDNYSENGVDVRLSFDFDPSLSECTGPCNSIGFIQIVRTLDLDNPKHYYYPSAQKEQRATDQGWYVDRGEGYEWVYFGRQNGVSPAFESYVHPGTESVLATMNDQPYRPENHPFLGIRWQAVTVPVCMDIDNEGGQHGFLAWSWTVTRQGTVENVQSKVAKVSLENDIKEALVKWNGQHEAWGTIKHPVLQKLTTN